jgi:hypothetical protein
VGGSAIKSYLISYSAYLIHTYLMKNYRSRNVANVNHEDKKQFDKSMNRGQVVIEHAFAALKDRWKILKKFLDEENKSAGETLACCILHNFCKMRRLPIPITISIQRNKNILEEFDNPIPHLADGRTAKEVGKAMRDYLFAEWHVNNPPSPPLQHPLPALKGRGLQLVSSGQSTVNTTGGRGLERYLGG